MIPEFLADLGVAGATEPFRPGYWQGPEEG